ncbi:MAG: hypothetical protein HY865_08985 [Chloroflexi bacterium]|nr:hypothetical protein [Chloroflexota bacterium]
MNKKMTPKEIKDLKAKHRLELVMQEAGERFEADPKSPDILRSASGLAVNTRMQTYEITRPGAKVESGDVLAWLQVRYSWSFAMALKYLQKRAPDPRQEVHPRPARGKRSTITYQQSDYVTVSNIYTDPETGAQSYGSNYNYNIMDELQKHALELWSGVVKYFDKSSDEVWQKILDYPSRFKPVIDFDVEKCANCEKPFNWQAGAIGYAQEKAEYISVVGCSDVDKVDITGNLAEVDELFIDQDFVICESCLRGIFAPRYKALRLVYRSARRRKKAAEEERKQIERERAEEEEREREREEERMNIEAACL